MKNSEAPSAREIVEKLGLIPHPEGGFYRETHRASLELERPSPSFSGKRAASTAIYYLLGRGDFSALHRIASDEVWHHYLGATLTVHTLDETGRYEALRVGSDLRRGALPQAVVPASAWFGARIEEEDEGEFALVGCTVAPGFDFADFELGTQARLLEAFPQHEEIVRALTRC